jgi:hypothetical protein
MPGAVAIFGALVAAGVPINMPDEASRTILGDLGLLPHFATVIGGISGLPRKPDPGGRPSSQCCPERLLDGRRRSSRCDCCARRRFKGRRP